MNRPVLEDSLTLEAVLRCSHSGRRGHEALAIHGQLRQLAGVRERFGETLGHLAALLQITEGWRSLGFASFDQYCEERLGMDPREVERLAARARKQLRRVRSADVRALAAAKLGAPQPKP